MNDNPLSSLTLSERFEELGFEISATDDVMQSSVKAYVAYHAGRSTVGPVFVVAEADDEDSGAPFQFTKEHDRLFKKARSKKTEGPTIYTSMQRSVMSTIVESLVLAVQPVGGDINQASKCLRVDVYVAAARAFQTRFVFERLFRHCFKLMFSEDLLPVINVVFVDFLTVNAAMSVVFEYAVDEA